jgi:hypothetical protein
MISRSLYHFLLRLHPAHFRNKFEDQMLWIFDESVASRGAASLLLDALVSLVRQWVLRSSYWRHARPPIAMDGATALTEQLRQNSEALHRRAWRLNLIWMIGAFIVLLLSRLQLFWGPFVIVIFANAIGTYLRTRQGRRERASVIESVRRSLLRDPVENPKLYRQQMEGKRDGLIAWGQFKPSKILWNADGHQGGKFLAVLLVVAGLLMLMRPLRPGASYDWMAFIEFLSGLIVLLVCWRFVKKVNQRAAQAIQQEIDALDDSSRPQSV